MVSGERIQSRPHTSGPSRIIVGKTTNADGNGAGVIENLFASLSSGEHRFMAAGKPDPHRAKSSVGRRMRYGRGFYIDWEDNMESIALCVFLMSTTRGKMPRRKPNFSISILAGNSSGRTEGRGTYMRQEHPLVQRVSPRAHDSSVYGVRRVRRMRYVAYRAKRRYLAIRSRHICRYE